MTRQLPAALNAFAYTIAVAATLALFVVAGWLIDTTVDDRNYFAAATVYIGTVWLLKNSVTWLTHATERSDR